MSWGWGEGQGSSLGSQMAHASPSQSYATANQILTLLRLRIPGSGKQGYRQNLSSRSVVKQKANAVLVAEIILMSGLSGVPKKDTKSPWKKGIFGPSKLC